MRHASKYLTNSYHDIPLSDNFFLINKINCFELSDPKNLFPNEFVFLQNTNTNIKPTSTQAVTMLFSGGTRLFMLT